jgi:LysR family transcriptional regulator, benzoate and cis,cis-muconate-responsive activator of ben and cat genes
LDVGFIRPRRTYPEGVTASVIYEEKLLLAVPKNHPLAATGNLRLLASETFIVPTFDENSGFMDYVADFISKPMHAPQETIGVRDFLTALCLVASGSGVALVPESLRSVVMRNVTYCTIGNYDRPVGLAIAYRTDRLEPAVHEFVQLANHVRYDG